MCRWKKEEDQAGNVDFLFTQLVSDVMSDLLWLDFVISDCDLVLSVSSSEQRKSWLMSIRTKIKR